MVPKNKLPLMEYNSNKKKIHEDILLSLNSAMKRILKLNTEGEMTGFFLMLTYKDDSPSDNTKDHILEAGHIGNIGQLAEDAYEYFKLSMNPVNKSNQVH